MTNDKSGCLGFLHFLLRGASSEEVNEDKQLQRFPYIAANILTDGEKAFFGVLDSAIGRQCRILMKVRLIDLIQVRPHEAKAQKYKNKIIQKHVDFVLCSKNQLRTLLIIELDDKSHNTKKAKDRDHFVDEAVSAAGLKILRVKAAANYDMDELQAKINAASSKAPETPGSEF